MEAASEPRIGIPRATALPNCCSTVPDFLDKRSLAVLRQYLPEHSADSENRALRGLDLRRQASYYEDPGTVINIPVDKVPQFVPDRFEFFLVEITHASQECNQAGRSRNTNLIE